MEDRRSTAPHPPCRRSYRGHRPTRHQPTRQGRTWFLRCIGPCRALNRQPRPCRRRQRRPEQNLKLVRILINKKFSPVKLHCVPRASPTGSLWPWQSEEYLSFVAICHLLICYLNNILLPLISIEQPSSSNKASHLKNPDLLWIACRHAAVKHCLGRCICKQDHKLEARHEN